MSIPAQGAVGAETMTAAETVTILYENYRGETAVRRIIVGAPRSDLTVFWIGASEWHSERQWLFSAWDLDKQAYRDFAMAGIKAWGQAAVDAALASPRADSDERTADEGTEWFWRIVDANGLGNVPSEEGEALRLLCTKAAWYDEMRATPAQPAGAVPDSLRADLNSLVKTLKDTIAVWDKWPETADSGAEALWQVIPLVERILAAHPAGQSAGSGAEDYQHPGWKTYQQHGVLRTPNSPRTGDEGTEENEPVATVLWYDPEAHFGEKRPHKIIDASMAFMDAAEIGTKLYARPLTTHPAAPEAQGSWSFDMEAAPRDGTPVIVAAESHHKDGEPIVGEAYIDADNGGHWWWAGESYGDYHASPLHEVGNPPYAWHPMLDAPAPPTSSGQGGR